MRAAVTGATGFVGRHLVEALLAEGAEVVALLRPTADATGLPEGVRVVRGDVTDPEAVREAVQGVDVVFHLAGIRRAARREVFMAVNAEGTRNVADAAAACTTPPRVVLAGSLAATGPARAGRPVREEDPFRPFEWYGESKARAEEILAGYDGRVPWTVLRPPRILGPGDAENRPFFKLVARGWRLEIGGPPRPMSMVDVSDVVRALLLLARHDAALGEAFFVAADGAMTLAELQEAAARAFGVELRPLRVPPALLWTLATVADGLTTLTGRRLPLNRKLARQLTAPSWECATGKIRSRLGFEPAVSLEESVKASARWYREAGLV